MDRIETRNTNSTGIVRRLRSRPVLIGGLALGVVLVVVVLVVFQPQRLLYDNVVDEAFPGTDGPDPSGSDQSTPPDLVDQGADADMDEDRESEVDQGADADMDEDAGPEGDPGAGQELDEAASDDAEVVDEPETGTEVDDMPRRVEPVVLGTGSFASRSRYTVTGQATAYRLEDGSRALRLEDFTSTNGPNLYVYLTDADSDADDAAFDADFVDLGALKGNVGNQNYDIPDDVDLEHYDTVVIWCRPFSVAFGAANLG